MILAVVLAVVGGALIAYAGAKYLQQKAEMASLVAPVPPSSAALTAPSSSPPTASATTGTPPPAASKPSAKAVPKTTSPPATVVTPVHIWIPAIGVNTRIVGKPSVYAMDNHLGYKLWQFGVPTGPLAMYEVAWWSDGPRPGEHINGRIPVLLGHTQIGGYGVFNQLGDLKPGEVLTLAAADPHQVQRYKVLVKPIGNIPKDDAKALLEVLHQAPKEADLALITCSGGVDASIMSHKDNTVVFFALIR